MTVHVLLFKNSMSCQHSCENRHRVFVHKAIDTWVLLSQRRTQALGRRLSKYTVSIPQPVCGGSWWFLVPDVVTLD